MIWSLSAQRFFFYNYLIIKMNGVGKTEQIIYSQVEKSKMITNTDYVDPNNIFNIQLTGSQATAIMKILPQFYSLHVDRTIKTKRAVKRTFALDKKNAKTKEELYEDNELNQVPQQPIYQPIQTIDYDEMIRKCQKILNLLRKNKNSWPFKDPVDPIVMGIPHYREIVTNPMDLSTVQENLLSHKYSTMSQFYADIQLIINNSFLFNKNNAQFYTLTSDFQKYFQKIKSQPYVTTANVVMPPVKKISSQPTNVSRHKSETKSAVQLSQRKQLASKLKQFSKQQLTQLIVRMNESGEKTIQLNLQTLPTEKIRFLQDYVSKKQQASHSHHNKAKQLSKKPANDVQSSFQSDSDS